MQLRGLDKFKKSGFFCTIGERVGAVSCSTTIVGLGLLEMKGGGLHISTPAMPTAFVTIVRDMITFVHV